MDGSERALRFSKNVATCSKCGEDQPEQPVDKDAVEIQSKLKQRPELFALLNLGKGKAKGGKGGKGGYPNTADHWKGKGK